MALYLGVQIPDNPRYVRTDISSEGHTLWEMSWKWRPEDEDRNVTFTVDEQDGITVEYYSVTQSEVGRTSMAAGSPQIITKEQSIATAQVLASQLLPSQANWTYISKKKNEEESDPLAPPIWWVIGRYRYMNAPVLPNSLSVYVVPYTGAISSFSYSKGAVLVPPISGTTITKEQAEQIALPHFLAFTASVRLPSDPTAPVEREGPVWAKLGNGLLCRLRYRFAYQLEAISGPEADPDSDLPAQGRTAQHIWVEVDAETGEIWSVANVAGSGAGGRAFIERTPRTLMLMNLDRQPKPTPLQIAIASGKTITATRPSKEALRFTQSVPIELISGETVQRVIPFALNPKRRFLTFEYLPGKWSGVHLNPEHFGVLQQWIAQKSSAP